MAVDTRLEVLTLLNEALRLLDEAGVDELIGARLSHVIADLKVERSLSQTKLRSQENVLTGV